MPPQTPLTTYVTVRSSFWSPRRQLPQNIRSYCNPTHSRNYRDVTSWSWRSYLFWVSRTGNASYLCRLYPTSVPSIAAVHKTRKYHNKWKTAWVNSWSRNWVPALLPPRRPTAIFSSTLCLQLLITVIYTETMRLAVGRWIFITIINYHRLYAQYLQLHT
jgi:hypothetical protein